MNMGKGRQRLPLVVRLLNPSKLCYRSSSEPTRLNMIKLGTSLIFTAIGCGLILSVSICRFCFDGNYHLMVYFAPSCFAFYVLLDRPIIFGNGGRGSLFTRVFIALVLTLFNSILIDSHFFRKDIDAALASELSTVQYSWKARHDKTVSEASAKKAVLRQDIGDIVSELSTRRDSLNTEAQGTGGSGQRGMRKIWNGMHDNYLADSADKARLIQGKEKEIASIDAEVEKDVQYSNSEIARATTGISHGISKEMEVLYKIIFKEGKVTNIAAWLLILFMSMFLELIPLITKISSDISGYFRRCRGVETMLDEEVRSHDQVNAQLMAVRMEIFRRGEEINLHYAAHKSEIRRHVVNTEELLAQMAEHLDELHEKERRLRKKYPAQFDTMFRPIFEHAYSKLAE